MQVHGSPFFPGTPGLSHPVREHTTITMSPAAIPKELTHMPHTHTQHERKAVSSLSSAMQDEQEKKRKQLTMYGEGALSSETL